MSTRDRHFDDDDQQRQEFRRQPPSERYLTGQDLEELRRALSRPRMERTVPPPPRDTRRNNLPELPPRRQMISLELPDSADFSAWCNVIGQALDVAAKKCKGVKDTALATLLKEKFKAAKEEVEQMFSDNKEDVTAKTVNKKEVEAAVTKGTSKDIKAKPFKLKLVTATA
jgi:hypothetical protein